MAGEEGGEEDTGAQTGARNPDLIRFPQSRTRPKQDPEGFRNLGLSALARGVRRMQPNLKGHWCSRCKGIWFGFVGEVECPACGNRHG